jgi:hypothetical protein
VDHAVARFIENNGAPRLQGGSVLAAEAASNSHAGIEVDDGDGVRCIGAKFRRRAANYGPRYEPAASINFSAREAIAGADRTQLAGTWIELATVFAGKDGNRILR